MCSLLICFAINAQATYELKAVASSHKMFQYIENGQLKGPSAQVFNMLMRKAETKANVEFYPWARALNLVLTQPNTLILSLTRTREREDDFVWLIKVNESRKAFVALKSKPEHFVKNIDQAKNKLVAVTRDSFSYKSLIGEGFTEDNNLYVVSTIESAIMLFKKGKVDLIYTDPEVMKNHYNDIGKESKKTVNITIVPEARRDVFIAINKQTNKQLLNQLKQASTNVSLSPQYIELLSKMKITGDISGSSVFAY
ncbi:MAG: polar amino acid transport system substrate-binding protein [Alteromonadaceae bacterium]|jgi:polar amino acid transport system substrate-binding protein